MDQDDRYRFTVQDFLFGLTGSTVFVIALHFFTN